MFHRWQFSCGEKRGAGVGKTKRGKGYKVMAIADGAGLPIALCAASASPGETKFVEELISHCITEDKPQRLIANKVYDSDTLNDYSHGYTAIAGPSLDSNIMLKTSWPFSNSLR